MSKRWINSLDLDWAAGIDPERRLDVALFNLSMYSLNPTQHILGQNAGALIVVERRETMLCIPNGMAALCVRKPDLDLPEILDSIVDVVRAMKLRRGGTTVDTYLSIRALRAAEAPLRTMWRARKLMGR